MTIGGRAVLVTAASRGNAATESRTGEEGTFPDPLSWTMAEGWRSEAAKGFERQLPALAEAEPSRHKQCHEAMEPMPPAGRVR